MTLFSFRKYNPEWVINLYLSEQKINKNVWDTPESQDFISKDYFNLLSGLNIDIKDYEIKSKNEEDLSPPQRSDLFEWDILATSGGFYSDMDVLFLKSINDLYEKTKDYDTGICYTEYYSIGFMFSNGNNKFFKDVYDGFYNKFDKSDSQGAGSTGIGRRWPSVKDIESNYGKVYNIPFNFFYKYDSNNVEKIYEINDLYSMDENCVGLHWYAGHSLSQQINSILNESNYKEQNTLLSRILKKVLEQKD
jgi:hypothetical protein